MKLNPFEQKEITRQDLRVRAYRENQWRDKEGFEPFEMALLVLFLGVILAVGVLLVGCIVWAKYSN